MAATEMSSSRPWQGFHGLKLILVSLLVGLVLLLLTPTMAQAKVMANDGEDGWPSARSLETLRDLDYESWRVVAYRAGPQEERMVLRIVGFPGRLRLDHPTDMTVHAGLRDWTLADITMDNQLLAGDVREAAAEFDLTALMADMNKNRPLRLELPGVFTELPIPPYVVEEWRSLPQDPPV
jgi:hypothetical protein